MSRIFKKIKGHKWTTLILFSLTSIIVFLSSFLYFYMGNLKESCLSATDTMHSNLIYYEENSFLEEEQKELEGVEVNYFQKNILSVSEGADNYILATSSKYGLPFWNEFFLSLDDIEFEKDIYYATPKLFEKYENADIEIKIIQYENIKFPQAGNIINNVVVDEEIIFKLTDFIEGEFHFATFERTEKLDAVFNFFFE